jgi:type II secretory pathway component PulF
MTVFNYTALDPTGRRLTGSVPAETRAAALDAVLGRGLSPISVDEERAARGSAAAAKSTPSTRVSQSAVESFTRELANLLAARSLQRRRKARVVRDS